MLTKTFTFKPVGKDFDNVLILEDEYPWAMAFIDMFYDKENSEIQDAIREGTPFKVKATFEIIAGEIPYGGEL